MFDSPEAMTFSVRITLLVCVLAPGLLAAATPWLLPRGEVFAVTLPDAALRDPRLLGLRRRYALTMVALTLILVVIALLNIENVAIFVAASLLLPIVGFFGMLACRSRVLSLKRSEGWSLTGSRTTSVKLPPEVPGPISLRWNLLYVPIILATIVLTVELYPAMPERLVMQAGFDGQANSFAGKTPWSAGLPVIVQLFMTGVLVACHIAIAHSKWPGASATPVATALGYGKFAQGQTIVLLGTGLGLTAGMATIPLADAGIVSLTSAVAVLMAVTLAALVASIMVALRYGQAGSRLGASVEESAAPDSASSDDDAHWKAGVIYVNPGDPSVVVPKRFGIGWTLNLGNWRGWLALAALVGVTVLFCAAVAAI